MIVILDREYERAGYEPMSEEKGVDTRHPAEINQRLYRCRGAYNRIVCGQEVRGDRQRGFSRGIRRRSEGEGEREIFIISEKSLILTPRDKRNTH